MIDRDSFPCLVPKRAHNFDFTFFFLQREISPSKRSPPTFSCVSSIHHNAYRRPSHTASSFNYKLLFTDMHRRHFFHAFRASSFHCLKTYPLYRGIVARHISYFSICDISASYFSLINAYYPPGKFPISIILQRTTFNLNHQLLI